MMEVCETCLYCEGVNAMKILKQLPKVIEALDEELRQSGWIPLKEPTLLSRAILYFIRFMLVNVISFFEYYVLLIIVHELLHCNYAPNFLCSKQTSIDFTWFVAFV